MTASASPEGTPQSTGPRVPLRAALSLPLILVILPLILAAMLFPLLFWALRSEGPSVLPSALIGKPVPEFALPALPGMPADSGPYPGLSSAELKSGKVNVLNVWASWCAPCIAEHPQLMELSRQGIPIYSINYKDKPDAARRFLANYGNPFRAIGADESGFTAIDFGVYGVPETFVIDRNGRIAFRFPGPLSPDILAQKIMPAIRKAEQETAAQD